MSPPRLTPRRWRDVVRVLESFGFERVDQSGSHLKLRHPDGRVTIVPVHDGRDIGTGLLRTIIREADLDRDEFQERLARA